jgi:hypothetical protein
MPHTALECRVSKMVNSDTCPRPTTSGRAGPRAAALSLCSPLSRCPPPPPWQAKREAQRESKAAAEELFKSGVLASTLAPLAEPTTAEVIVGIHPIVTLEKQLLNMKGNLV